MSPIYRQGEVYPHPYPAYFSVPPNVDSQPSWLESREPQPHYYYRETQPHYYYREASKRPWPYEWSYNEGRPYFYQYPAEGGYYYYPPKYRNSPPRFYEPDGMNFGRGRFYDPDGREFCRDFKPIYVHPPSSAPGPYAFRPFHPDEQFRHPDEYPMRFVPALYGPSEQPKAHCCGCPNHVCHPDTKTMKEIEPKQITEGNSVEELKPKSQNLQEFPGPVMLFPSGWRNMAASPERKDHIIEKEKHPVDWIPVNWNRNDKEPSRDRKGEDNERSPAYWFPVNWMRNDQTGEHDPRVSEYLTPLASSSSTQDEKENKKDAPVERNLHPFPLIWIPERRGNVSNTNTREESKGLNSQANCEDTKKTNGIDSRPVILQEIGKDDEKQRPAEIKKEIKARDIPVKQLEEEKPLQSLKAEEKSSQSHKTQEKVGDNHQKTSSPGASKLPPVCLRVDPLPGKKKSNGKSSSSRSPSPPHKSENPKESVTSSVTMEEKKPEENAKMNAPKKVEEKFNASTKTSIEKPREDVKLDDSKVAENENMQSKKAEVKKRELNRDHSALKIQACYRGYQVRRLQPLRKLREIAKIRERMEELKQQISTPEFVGEFSRDEKVKGRTHETLMGLLLQLDTIQGLHPAVRDVRKAVARELVLLQEKLDTWTEVAVNNNMEQQGSTKNNVRVEEEIIEKRDKDWEATEDSGKTLQNSNIENQQVDNEASKDEEKIHDKTDLLEVKKETRDEGRKETPVEEEKSNKEKREAPIEEPSNIVVEQEDYSTEHSEKVQGNALLNQEAPEVSETSAFSVVEMVNHDKEADVSGQIISTPDNAVENINEDKEQISEETISVSNSGEVYLENMKAEEEERSERQINIDSVLPQDLELQREVPPLSILVQEPEISDVGNSATLHQSNGDNALQGEVVLGVPEAEPEEKTSKEEIDISYSEANKTETEDLQNVVTEEIVGDKDLEPCVEVSSGAMSDIASDSRSDAYEENNLIALETNPPVEDNSRGEREFAAALAQDTYNPINGESVQIPTTEDASDVNPKDEFSICNEEHQEDHAPKCSGLSDDFEFRVSETEEKSVMELVSPTNDPHTENLSQSEAKTPQYGSKENEENWEEENEKLREMVEKLVESGKQQMSTISQLNEKIKSLESKLGKGNGKKKAKARHLKLKRNIVNSNANNASALKEI